MPQNRVCEVCLGAEAQVLPAYSTSEWPVVRCARCGFVFLHHAPEYGALSEEYAWEVTRTAEKKRRSALAIGKIAAVTRWRMTLTRLVRRRRVRLTRGRVLDIGCGGGCRIPEGPTPFGIEVSQGLAMQARPHFQARGGDVVHAPALTGLDSFSSDTFTAIIMRSYLEHEAQPRAVLTKAFARLDKGGVVYVRVPNFGSVNRRVMGVRWCGFRFPDHVNYFSGTTLRKMAEQIGFRYRRINWYSLLDDNLIVELHKA